MRFLIGLLALGLHWAALASMPTWRGAEIRQFGQSAAQPEVVYAISSGELFRSDDRGRTWRVLRLPSSIEFKELHVDPKNAQHVLVLSGTANDPQKSLLQESFDGGLNWAEFGPLKYSEPDGSAADGFHPTRFIGSVDGQTTDWWAYNGPLPLSSDSGRWLRSTDGGQTWARQPEGARASGAVRGRLLSYSLDQTALWRSGDAGQSWEKVHDFEAPAEPGGRRRRPSNLIVLDDDQLVMRDGRGNWLQSEDRGRTWAPASNGFQSLNQQWPSPETQASAPSRPFGETWCSAWRSPAAGNTLVARCTWDNGAMPSSNCFHVSTDNGQSWTPPRAPGSRPGAHCQAPGLPTNWSSTALLLDVADPRRMLAAWQAGGVFRSDDGRETWQASDRGLMFRNVPESEIDWIAISEPALIRAVLYRDRDALARLLASGVDVNSPGNRLSGVLGADLTRRETESQRGWPATPMMWTELRKAGATLSATRHLQLRGRWEKGLLERAVALELDDALEDLFTQGYDWGAAPSGAGHANAQDSELAALLRGPGMKPARADGLIDRYISAGRFPSADQTTLDLLNAERPDLAIKVVQASSGRVAFDRQGTTSHTPRLLIAQRLADAGQKQWARRVFAGVPPATVKAGGRDMDNLIGAITARCERDEGAWYRARGVPLTLGRDYGHCLSDTSGWSLAARLRLLRLMEKDGGIAPESWSSWLEDDDRKWLTKTAIYRRKLHDDRVRGNAIVGIKFGYDRLGHGMWVTDTLAGLAAESQGVRRGDVILSVDGRLIQRDSMGQVANRFAGQPGTWVRLDVLRDGKPMAFRLQRQPRPQEREEAKPATSLPPSSSTAPSTAPSPSLSP